MDPLTIDDLITLIGSQRAEIMQLQRHIAKLEKLTPATNGQLKTLEGEVVDARPRDRR